MSETILSSEALEEAVALVGRTGSGKTFLAKGVVEHLLNAGSRVCIIDPTSAWWGLRSNAAGDGPGFSVAIFGGDHADVPISVESAKPVAITNVGPLRVSTVFLGLDHQFGDGPPVLFETMVFGDLEESYQRRFETWDEAEEGHAKAVAIAEKQVNAANRIIDKDWR